MERLCERPGCSDPASVAYGMRAEDLVFWLDALTPGSLEHGVLCRRHADTMVVPRGWTLDDLRDPDLHLFRPPADDIEPTRRTRSRRSTGDIEAEPEQLSLGVQPVEPDGDEPGADSAAEDLAATDVAGEDASDSEDVEVVIPEAAPDTARGGSAEIQGATAEGETGPDGEVVPDDDAAEPWMPMFDTDDDLDGLLAARSPLLSRAFRGDRQS